MKPIPLSVHLLLLVALLLNGCGFHLRGQIPGSQKDKTLFISGVKTGSFYNNFSGALRLSGGHIANKIEEASAILKISSARHIRRPITLSSIGRANMFDLTFRVIYEIENTQGDTLVPQQELDIRREYFNTQGSPLGQTLEETQLRQEMEKEAAQTLLRQTVFMLQERKARLSGTS